MLPVLAVGVGAGLGAANAVEATIRASSNLTALLSGYYSARAGMMTGVVPEWIGRDQRRGVRQPHRGPVQQKQPRQQLLGRFGRVQLHFVRLSTTLAIGRNNLKTEPSGPVRSTMTSPPWSCMF